MLVISNITSPIICVISTYCVEYVAEFYKTYQRHKTSLLCFDRIEAFFKRMQKLKFYVAAHESIKYAYIVNRANYYS